MNLSGVKHARLKKSRNQLNASSDLNRSQSNCLNHNPNFPNPHPSILSNNNGSSESRESLISRKPKKKFLSAAFRGLGCKGASMPVSAPKIIRSAADWETEKMRRKNQWTKSHRRARTPNNLVDVPDICCTPPGISFASDVVPRSSMNPHRTTHIQHSRLARRTRNINDIPASSSQVHPNYIFSRAHLSNNARQYQHSQHHSYREISQVNPVFRGFDEYDEYMHWRLNVDSMSYEELLELSDKIGYVGRGLCEEDIFSCLRIFKLSDLEYFPLLMSIDKGWRCSICQEGCTADDDVGRLGCGHCHHIDCIRQWLKQKNQCPVCKVAPIADR